MSDDKLRVRDVLDRIHHFPEDHLYAWDGGDLDWRGTHPETLPVGGDRAYWGSFRAGVHWKSRDERLAEATHVEVLGTVWGDYVGSDYNRSNYRSLLRDYPDAFVDVTGHYGSSTLFLPLDAEIPVDLVEGLEGLLDYPIWDESDHSDLTMELEQEAWDSWGRDDWKREITRLAGQEHRDADEVEDYLDRLEDTEVNELASDAAYGPDGHGDHPMYVCEDAVNGYWEGFVDVWAAAGLRLVLERLDALDLDPAWKPVPVTEGQGLLDVG